MAQKTVTVFASSRTPKDVAVVKAAEELGTALGRSGFAVNYGGGDKGLMGIVAKAVAAAGGTVNAIVFYKNEIQPAGANIVTAETEKEWFDSLYNYGNPSAMIVLPGGASTFREVGQSIENAVYHAGPPVFLVRAGTQLDGIKRSFDTAVQEGLIDDKHRDKVHLLTAYDTIATLTGKPLSPYGFRDVILNP